MSVCGVCVCVECYFFLFYLEYFWMDLKRVLPLKLKHQLQGVYLQIWMLPCCLSGILILQPCSDSAFPCTLPATTRKQEVRLIYNKESSTFTHNRRLQWPKYKPNCPARVYSRSWKFVKQILKYNKITAARISNCYLILFLKWADMLINSQYMRSLYL